MRSGFLRYCIRRLLQLVPVMLAISVVNFILIRVAPGDPALYLVGATQATPEVYQQLRTEFGLDRSLIEQLAIYFDRLFHLDLGYSFVHQAPVLDTILSRLPATFLLMGTAFVLASLIGIGLGVLAARRAHSMTDQAIVLTALAGYSMPVFWLGQFLVLVFSLHLDWFPSQGMRSMREQKEGFDLVLDVLHHLVLPATTYAIFHLALVFRLTRNKMLDVIVMDYILTARAKGASAWRALLRHALPNALAAGHDGARRPLRLHDGRVGADRERVRLAGMGRLIFEALESRDYPVISGIFLIVSAMIILANLLTDLIYAWLDPRVVLR